MIIWFLAGLIILITLGVLYFGLPEFTSQVESADGPWNLNQSPAISSETLENFTKNLNGTLRVFYYIDVLPRTSTFIMDDSVSSFNPQTNTFGICEKSQNTKCEHPGFIKLLNVNNSLYIELLQAPDASRPGLPKTQLVIQTQKVEQGTTKTYLETFALPEFPIQKWVMLTIVRSGNRFNIYYNGRLVFSNNTTYIPNILEGSGTLSSAGVRGEAKYFLTAPTAAAPTDIAADYSNMADTTGKPFEKLFSKINVTLCPSGECFSGPRIRPANPLIDWSSDVM